MITLDTNIENLTRVGKTVASKLKRLNILTVQDLIFWYPFRYEDFSNLKLITDLKPGDITTVKGKIELLNNKRSVQKKMIITECFLTDNSGSIKAIWFRQPFIIKTLNNNDEVFFSGKVEGDLFNLYFKNPAYEKVSLETSHTARIVPIYPLTEGLSQKQIRFLIKQSLNALDQIKEWLPDSIRKEYQLIGLNQALKNIHFPENDGLLESAKHRLKFDELLKLHLQNYLIKKDLDKSQATPLEFNETETKKIVDNLNFTLTNAQRKTSWQILQDMAKPRPMNRLLEGDVGSGKTVVAALAIANCALNGYQTALLAPTEILASQHFDSLKKILKSININIALLTRVKHEVLNTADKGVTSISKTKLIRSINNGEIQLTIGTHTLIQETVNFKKLGLVIIDEQHRFGVEQRKILRNKSGNPKTTPHLLSMTATPIPRTLALTVYGDLNLSIIDELPPGRKKPITKLVEQKNRNQAYDFIYKQINQGRQAFVICPLIDESDPLRQSVSEASKLGIKAVTEEYKKLSKDIFPELKIGLLHGKLKPKEKDEIMQKFANNTIQILVSTSVVEVGVNIPNANVMIIESAERFGLSQLHQFRGRVNRSLHQSYCFLFSENNLAKTSTRLKALVDCFDGFKLAEIDLTQRGSGSLFGTKQSGFFSDLKIASLTDVKLIEETKKALNQIIKNDPQLKNFSKIKQILTNIHPE